MNRREILGAGVVLTVSGQALAQPVTRVKIIELEKLSKVWDDAEFKFQGEACVLVRVPVPNQPNPRLFEHQKKFFSAFSRTCTHIGCISQLPNGLRQLECGCHGSVFSALDGTVISGPASQALKAVKLEVDAPVLYATAWHK